MELLTSKRFKLPTVYYVTERKELSKIPIGVPYIFGDERNKEDIVRILEYELLYAKAKATGLPFKFKDILKRQGYADITYSYHIPAYIGEGEDTERIVEREFTGNTQVTSDSSMFKQFINDMSVYVDIQVLKDLNVFPIWLSNIENAVETNIHNYAVFNPYMYNHKLEGMYGGVEFSSPNRNLVIIDISSSIPRGVSSTILALAKHLSLTFFADILITGTISTLYRYEDIDSLDVDSIYETNGMNNDQEYFKKLVSIPYKYDTAIVFGDNDFPGYMWEYADVDIDDSEGKGICKWKINKLISLHTESTYKLAGYARWFSPLETEKISNWVEYLND